MRHRGTIGLGLLLLVALYLTSLSSYLLFHTVVELFTIVVAGGIFVLAWNTRAYLNNNYLLSLAIAYVFVAVLVLFHTLTYPGMGVFAGSSANLTTQLWIAGRYLSATSWLLAPFFLGRTLRTGVQIAVYTAVTAILMWSIIGARIFPTTYIDGVGLSPFKKISEYLVGALFVTARVLLIRWAAYSVLYISVVEMGLVAAYWIYPGNLKRSGDGQAEDRTDHCIRPRWFGLHRFGPCCKPTCRFPQLQCCRVHGALLYRRISGIP